MIRSFFFLNGIYDVLCAACILNIVKIPILSELHLSMLKVHTTPSGERYLAYWIFTYGVIRMSTHTELISLSYWLEAVFILNEYMNDAVYGDKALFVILSSIGSGMLCYL
jgi:hypothetical protein